MHRGLTGYFVALPSAGGEKARAFVPNPLPPDPPLEIQPELQELIGQAMLAVGRIGLARTPVAAGSASPLDLNRHQKASPHLPNRYCLPQTA